MSIKMRPTKYDESIIKQPFDYTDDYEIHGHAVPSLEGLADVLKVRMSIIENWAKQPEHSELKFALSMLNNKQHLELLNKGLTGKLDVAIVKLMLVNYHGYMDYKPSESSRTEIFKNKSNPTKNELLAIISGSKTGLKEVA